jgi:hypothetical protein
MQSRQERVGFTGMAWFALWFGVCWLILRIYRPQDAHSFGRMSAIVILFLVLYAVAERFFSDANLTGALALGVAFGTLLLFVVPHHALEHPPKTPVGKALLMAGGSFVVIVWFLVIVDV